jgi:hypothetical protein
MKHTQRSFATVLFSFLLLFVFINCAEQKKEDQQEDPPMEQEEVEAPKQIVGLDQAKESYDNYTRRRVGIIEKSEGPKPDGSKFDATRYTYYDLTTIKQYIAYIEQEAKRANVEISSLRFYLSNYPDSTSFRNGNKVVHPRQNSVFLVPTTQKDGLEYPFMLEDKEGKWEAVLLSGQLDPLGEKGMGMQQQGRAKNYAGFGPNSATINLSHHGKSLFLNEGSSAPPPYH